jgi:NAD-dependent deacetylase
VQPNPAHYALVELERRLPGDHFTLATQNVDTLHTLAGSQRVLELQRQYPPRPVQPLRLSRRPPARAVARSARMSPVRRAAAAGYCLVLRTVARGSLGDSLLAVAQCDCLLVVGTSAVVHPAAGLIELAKQHDAAVIEVNLDQTAASHLADVSLLGKAGQILPQLVAASA